jgi:Caspase domain
MSAQRYTRNLLIVILGVVLLLCHVRHAAADATQLSVLLLIDTNAGKVGGDEEIQRQGALADLKRLRRLIDDVYQSQWPKFKGRMTLDILKDKDVSPAKIREYYHMQPFKPDRALMLFYSGHGAYDAKKGHFFATSGGSILRSEVYELMNDCGPQAIFLFSDCCSTYGEMPSAASADSGSRQQKQVNWRAFYNLFFQSQGRFEVTAASRGEASWFDADNGGYFTTALALYLYKPNSAIRLDGKEGAVTWRDLFGRVRDLTVNIFKQRRNNAAASDPIREAPSQVPDALALGKWPTQYRKQLLVKNNTDKTLRVWLRYHDLDFSTNQWKWFNPTENGKSYAIKPGQSTRLLDNGWPVGGNSLYIWAASEDGSTVWEQYRDQPLRLVLTNGYQGPMQQHEFSFDP